ncbi:hypothetical protein [Pseudomonas gingeri]
MPHTSDHNAPEPEQGRNWFAFLVTFIVCTAVFLGVYFIRLNLEVDREREALAERLVRCREQRLNTLSSPQFRATLQENCSSIEAEFLTRFGYAR